MKEVRRGMAVTRREFITTLGMLATAVGIGEADLAKVTEAFAHGGAWKTGGWTNKPKVVWVHGAECTGCSTSLLSLFEDATGVAIPGAATPAALGGPTKPVLTAQALGFIAANDSTYPVDAAAAVAALTNTAASHPNGHRTLAANNLNVDGSAYAVNIADVLIDFIDLQYHETVMAAGGDGAYAYLRHEMDTSGNTPFVLVVEGAMQHKDNVGYWNASGSTEWCTIAADGTDGGTDELAMYDVVAKLASKVACKAVVAIGQCATFGGYPACKGPDLVNNGFGKSMTGAQGAYDFLKDHGGSDAAGVATKDKVVNVPGCPANPWWFTLTVVAWMVDAVYATATSGPGVLGILNADLTIKGGVDSTRRLTAVYGDLLHSMYCPRYPMYAKNIFASKPGEDGCLKNIGCKGLWTYSSCGRHGWNNAQPQNATINAAGVLAVNASGSMFDASGNPHAAIVSGNKVPPLYTNHDYNNGTEIAMGGCCLTAGAPCMGCTEKGYPDAMTPFVVR